MDNKRIFVEFNDSVDTHSSVKSEHYDYAVIEKIKRYGWREEKPDVLFIEFSQGEFWINMPFDALEKIYQAAKELQEVKE